MIYTILKCEEDFRQLSELMKIFREFHGKWLLFNSKNIYIKEYIQNAHTNPDEITINKYRELVKYFGFEKIISFLEHYSKVVKLFRSMEYCAKIDEEKIYMYQVKKTEDPSLIWRNIEEDYYGKIKKYEGGEKKEMVNEEKEVLTEQKTVPTAEKILGEDGSVKYVYNYDIEKAVKYAFQLIGEKYASQYKQLRLVFHVLKELGKREKTRSGYDWETDYKKYMKELESEFSEIEKQMGQDIFSFFSAPVDEAKKKSKERKERKKKTIK